MVWQVKKIDDFSQSALEQCLALMIPARRAQVEAIRHPGRRIAALCGEWLAKQMLAAHTGRAIEEITISRTEAGKPYAENCPAHFNLSHSGEFIACAVDDAPLGIDIEAVKPLDLKVARRVCTDPELEYLAPERPDALRRFYKIWTAKEAYFKARGTGITDLKSITYFDLQPHLQQVETESYILSIYQK